MSFESEILRRLNMGPVEIAPQYPVTKVIVLKYQGELIEVTIYDESFDDTPQLLYERGFERNLEDVIGFLSYELDIEARGYLQEAMK